MQTNTFFFFFFFLKSCKVSNEPCETSIEGFVSNIKNVNLMQFFLNQTGSCRKAKIKNWNSNNNNILFLVKSDVQCNTGNFGVWELNQQWMYDFLVKISQWSVCKIRVDIECWIPYNIIQQPLTWQFLCQFHDISEFKTFSHKRFFYTVILSVFRILVFKINKIKWVCKISLIQVVLFT